MIINCVGLRGHLLIFSFFVNIIFNNKNQTSTLDALAESISALDEGVVAEAILDVATVSDLESETELRKLKLDSLSHQRELMDDEREELEDELEKSEVRFLFSFTFYDYNVLTCWFQAI